MRKFIYALTKFLKRHIEGDVQWKWLAIRIMIAIAWGKL